jgi:hypothetical protein
MLAGCRRFSSGGRFTRPGPVEDNSTTLRHRDLIGRPRLEKLAAPGLVKGCHDPGMARAGRRILWLAVGVLVAFGAWKGAWMLDRSVHPERYRGIDMIAAVEPPGSWHDGGDPSDQFFPANTGKQPFQVPYNRWTHRYWAPEWSLAGSLGAYDAAARAAGWQPDACPPPTEQRPTKTPGCWKRPNFVLTADFTSTDPSCNPRTHNCGTTIDVELAERTAG